MNLYTLIVEYLEQDCIGTTATCLGIFSSKDKLFDFFISYLLHNHVYDICTEEEMKIADELHIDPICGPDSKFPACDGRGKTLAEVWNKEQLVNHFDVAPGIGKREYTIGETIF